ncbi:farnesol dehydrogenase-like [Cylas formicarius]|uniref:farnesol dehydrogenase-like n=1 Tax=Cylas formicarius TaxID=197179 RepID=UPI002958BB4D|nr:farnesol dehydrogenase-like [Cylas formicarius]
MERWSGKVAVVTGASAGIGAAIAEVLVSQHLQVVGVARRLEKLEELAAKWPGKNGQFIPLKGDISDKDDVLRIFKWIGDNVGPVSILINNAGVGKRTSIVNGNIDDWKTVMDTNFFGLAIASREAIKSMQDHHIDGHIVNINSTLGHVVINAPNQNLYPASKHAVTAFTETLRKDLVAMKSKIKVSSVSPGFVDTDIWTANHLLEDEHIKEVFKTAPKLSSEDVANAVLAVLATPPHVQIVELIVKPVGELF